MLVCQNCNHSLEQEAERCPQCGAELVQSHEEVGTTNEAEYVVFDENPPVEVEVAQKDAEEEKKESEKVNWNEYADKGKVVAKNYWSYALHQLRSPFFNGEQVIQAQWVNAVISIFVFVFFYSMSNVVNARKLSMGLFGGKVPVFETFFITFLQTTLFVGITVGLLWVIVRYWIRNEVTFLDVVARFGTFTLVSSLLTVVLFIISWLGNSGLSVFILILALLGWIASITLILYSYHREAPTLKADPLYSILAVFALLYVYHWIAGEKLTSTMLRGFFLPFF